MSNRDAHPPAAFLSYARFNDRQDDDRITAIRQKLAGEVQTVTGNPFEIFQDRLDIRVGEQWKARIEETIDSATLLISILTPSFFKSEYCRKETQQFVEREKRLGRRDLIIPIYYVGMRALENDERSDDELIELMKARQRFDATKLRFVKLDSTEMLEAVNAIAVQIQQALERFPAVTAAAVAPAPTAQPAPAAEPIVQTGDNPAQAAATSEPRTLIVDMLRGPHRTIADALAVAASGDRIIVRPGTYDEGLLVDKPLEILGEGKAEEIIVQTERSNALAFRTTLGRVANVTFRQLGGGDYFAVDITQGRLTLERCRIESASLAGIAIHGAEAEPIVRNSTIHRCRQSGVIVFDRARGTLEENDVANNSIFGILIRDGASPVLRGNQVHDNEHGGVSVDAAVGRIEDNSIFSNRAEGVLVSNQATPELRRNSIYKNAKAGIYLYDGGAGEVKGNEIFDNLNSGIALRTQAHPVIQENTVTGNNGKGVWCDDAAAGVVENNVLRHNKFGAFWMSNSCTTKYVGNQEE
jgi:parallel beta-helix repeat protein